MKFALTVFAAVVIAGGIAIALSWSYDLSACAVEEYNEFVKLSLDHYSATVERLLTLSTALVAFGSALLLGFQQAPKLTGGRRLLILASTSCFVFSAYFALHWQSWLAQLLLWACPKLIADPMMRFLFQASTYSFLAGLALAALVVLFVAFDASSHGETDEGIAH